MIEISKDANKNYLCKVVKISNLRPHSNADKLQMTSIDFQDVVVGLNVKEGDLMVFFPLECKINNEFLSYTNSFRNKELNQDKEKTGFFDDNGRVKAVKLRGEKSMGYLVSADQISNWSGYRISYKDINQEFDTIGSKKLVEKYFVRTKQSNAVKQGKSPKLSRLIEGQAHLHVDTENFRKNIHKINPEDTISITYKTHGTSWWCGNLLVKKHLKWYERLLQKIGIKIVNTEYDILYGSRRVVKNQYEDNNKTKDHFYSYDLWNDIKQQVEDKIPKGYTLYGECLGYTKDGGYIQNKYDYGCKQGEFKLEVYRITHTTPDGLVTELSYPEIKEFCERVGLTPSHLFYYGTVYQYLSNLNSDGIKYDERDWREKLLKYLESKHNEKDCFMCANKVVEEGIVIRKESLFNCEVYKLKSFRFLEQESDELDKGVSNIEEEN